MRKLENYFNDIQLCQKNPNELHKTPAGGRKSKMILNIELKFTGKNVVHGY